MRADDVEKLEINPSKMTPHRNFGVRPAGNRLCAVADCGMPGVARLASGSGLRPHRRRTRGTRARGGGAPSRPPRRRRRGGGPAGSARTRPFAIYRAAGRRLLPAPRPGERILVTCFKICFEVEVVAQIIPRKMLQVLNQLGERSRC